MQSELFATITILVICLFGKGLGADLEMKCPQTWIAGEVSTVTVVIDSAAVRAADCYLVSDDVVFFRKRTSDDPKGQSEEICKADYSCASPGPVTIPVQNDAGSVDPKCGCVAKDGDVVTFEMKLVADLQQDAKANFTFVVCQAPRTPPEKVVHSSCFNAIVEPKEEGGGCGGGCIGGIVGALVGVIVMIVIVVIVVKRKGKWSGQPVPT